MTLAEHIQQCLDLIKTCPKAANMEVFNTSCFDDPLRFPTSGVYVGVVTVDADNNYYAFAEATDDPIAEKECVVIEAM